MSETISKIKDSEFRVLVDNTFGAINLTPDPNQAYYATNAPGQFAGVDKSGLVDVHMAVIDSAQP